MVALFCNTNPSHEIGELINRVFNLCHGRFSFVSEELVILVLNLIGEKWQGGGIYVLLLNQYSLLTSVWNTEKLVTSIISLTLFPKYTQNDVSSQNLCKRLGRQKLRLILLTLSPMQDVKIWISSSFCKYGEKPTWNFTSECKIGYWIPILK